MWPARHSGRGGTPGHPRTDAAVCSDSRSPTVASGPRRAALSALSRTRGWPGFKKRVGVGGRDHKPGARRNERTDHRGAMSQAELDETAVENFREYLRIPSVHPDINYGERPRASEITRGLPRAFREKAVSARRTRAAEARATAGEKREICDARLKASGGESLAVRCIACGRDGRSWGIRGRERETGSSSGGEGKKKRR